MYIELKRNGAGQWFWRIMGGNHQVLAHSEGYSSRAKARKTAWRVWEEFTGGNVKVYEEAS